MVKIQIFLLSLKRVDIICKMALIMGYLKISWAISIFHQVALLATMCFCLIYTPAHNQNKLPHLTSFTNWFEAERVRN